MTSMEGITMTDMWSFPGAAAAFAGAAGVGIGGLGSVGGDGHYAMAGMVGGNCFMEGIVPGMEGVMIVVDLRAVQ